GRVHCALGLGERDASSRRLWRLLGVYGRCDQERKQQRGESRERKESHGGSGFRLWSIAHVSSIRSDCRTCEEPWETNTRSRRPRQHRTLGLMARHDISPYHHVADAPASHAPPPSPTRRAAAATVNGTAPTTRRPPAVAHAP